MKKISLDCPNCQSGNNFQFEEVDGEISCEDCGFLLANIKNNEINDFKKCFFCGNEHFYFASPFSISFLGQYLVCYICEAKYTGIKIKTADAKFDEKVESELENSDVAKSLQEKVKIYNQ